MIGGYFGRKPQFDIFPMETSDVRAVSLLQAARFAHAWSDGEFHALLSQETVFGFMARQIGLLSRNTPAGFVLSRAVAGEAEILTIAVDARFGRCGLGWRLMQAAMREARSRGSEEMFLEVDEANVAAVGLYTRLGFRKVGERRGYYRDGSGAKSTALVMRRDLR